MHQMCSNSLSLCVLLQFLTLNTYLQINWNLSKKENLLVDNKRVKETLNYIQLLYVAGTYKAIHLRNLLTHQVFPIQKMGNEYHVYVTSIN